MKINVKLKPFNVPSFVIVDDPKSGEVGFHISTVDEAELEAMADQFKQDLLARARKSRPNVGIKGGADE